MSERNPGARTERLKNRAEAEPKTVPVVQISQCEACIEPAPAEIVTNSEGEQVELTWCDLDEDHAELINQMVRYAIIHNARLNINDVTVPWYVFDGLIQKKEVERDSVKQEEFVVEGALEVLKEYLERQKKQTRSTSKSRG